MEYQLKSIAISRGEMKVTNNELELKSEEKMSLSHILSGL